MKLLIWTSSCHGNTETSIHLRARERPLTTTSTLTPCCPSVTRLQLLHMSQTSVSAHLAPQASTGGLEEDPLASVETSDPRR